MSPLTLTLRQALSEAVDLSRLRLPPTGSEPIDTLARSRIHLDGHAVEAGELFDITGDDPENVALLPERTRIHGIGTGMAGGSLTVHGDAGDHLAFGMTAGTLRVEGSCGDFAASGLEGGMVQVRGSAGASLAGAIPGAMSGARGGMVVVAGGAGDRACDRMRRGLVLVGGDSGDFPASRLRAGTLIVLGHPGAKPGFGMKRGTLVLARVPEALPGTFNRSGDHELLYLRLLSRHVKHELGGDTPPLMDLSRVHRWVGDRAHDGRGEILVPMP